MALRQKLVTVDQIESGREGVKDLGERLDNLNTEADRVNEVVMTMASAPVSTPQFDAMEYFTVDAAEKEVTKLKITELCSVAGDVTATIDGKTFVASVLTTDSKDEMAAKLMAVVEADTAFVVSINVAELTITAVNTGEFVDAAFDGALTGVVAEIVIVLQGQEGFEIRDGVAVITIPNSITYKVGKGNLTVLRNGVPQIGFYEEVGELAESSGQISFAEGFLKDEDYITFIVGKAAKLDYEMDITYYTEGESVGRVETVTYSGDIDRVITYTYDAAGKILSETIAEDEKVVTKTFAYDPYNGKIVSVDSVVV